MQKPPRKKKCEMCRNVFQPERMMQPCCGISCALQLVNKKKAIKAKREESENKKREKIERRIRNQERKEQRIAVKPISWFYKRTEIACNAFVRERDRYDPCISCKTNDSPQWDAGHYRPAGNNPAIRFNPRNIHKQCSRCNQFWSGNITGDAGGRGYRLNLIDKVGMAEVEWLERDHGRADWTREELDWLYHYFNLERKKMVIINERQRTEA